MASEISWPRVLETLATGSHLSIQWSTWAMGQIIAGDATPAQIAAFLMGLRVKGETVDEIVGFRDAVLSAAERLDVPSSVLDIVGTGGDPYGAVLNISSVASIVAAATGVPVVKHGNRKASSSSGASDFLSALGVRTDLSAAQAAEVFHTVGITFANAGLLHPGFRHVSGIRREMGVSTLFNVIGPLCNPARPEASAVGVANADRAPLIAGVFQTRGATALVFRGDDGIDKLTTTGHSHLWEVSQGAIREHDLDPRDLGIGLVPIEALLGEGPEYNAAVARTVLDGDSGAVRDVVLLNAAAGIVAAELSAEPTRFQQPLLERFRAALAVASRAVDSGAARATLEAWAAATHTAAG
ncbi:anthranilate phosphoribosyltransferase [Pseudonocardia spinosispora]|uniref:anthranilate phosphoribosyltransferase n=1 Tax=Pseudonocardia spinosispora TaxID=103441 RepID=UPI00041BD857|nr:anthranilate phosphoribosyltransferase [Pseudonocardia spinosispora]